MNKNTSKTIILGLMKWKKKAIMLKAQHRQRSMILELHKRNREQKIRIQASYPIKRIQATLQIWCLIQLTIINLRDTPNLQIKIRIQSLQIQFLQAMVSSSSMPIKTDLSIVDKILMEESSCSKHSKTGSVNKAKKLQLNPVTVVYSHG